MRRIIAQRDGETIRISIIPAQLNSTPLIIVLTRAEFDALMTQARKVDAL